MYLYWIFMHFSLFSVCWWWLIKERRWTLPHLLATFFDIFPHEDMRNLETIKFHNVMSGAFAGPAITTQFGNYTNASYVVSAHSHQEWLADFNPVSFLKFHTILLLAYLCEIHRSAILAIDWGTIPMVPYIYTTAAVGKGA